MPGLGTMNIFSRLFGSQPESADPKLAGILELAAYAIEKKEARTTLIRRTEA
jgi:hypothetical protein